MLGKLSMIGAVAAIIGKRCFQAAAFSAAGT
jgi:hypothetical protein